MPAWLLLAYFTTYKIGGGESDGNHFGKLSSGLQAHFNAIKGSEYIYSVSETAGVHPIPSTELPALLDFALRQKNCAATIGKLSLSGFRAANAPLETHILLFFSRYKQIESCRQQPQCRRHSCTSHSSMDWLVAGWWLRPLLSPLQ